MNKSINIRDILQLALDSLRKNKLRSILATSGIIIGISTVILVFSISHAAENLVREQLSSFGTDTIFIEVKVPNASEGASASAIVGGYQVKTMKLDDVIGVRKIPNVKNSYGIVIAQEKVVYKENAEKTFIYGTSPSFINIDAGKVNYGRYFNESEDKNLAKVAVLGSTIKEKLFRNENPIGENIRIKNVNFKIIGVMKERGAAFFQNYDDYVYLPIQTQQKLLLGYDHLPYFTVQVENPEKMAQTSENIAKFLRKQHKIDENNPEKDDFQITTSEESQEMIGVVFGAVTILFTGIAALSLIVGGVGIMNIMYVSVTERIREIGLRKAIGAKKKAILLQFLLEALTITLLGGIIGILLGLILGSGISGIAQLAGVNLRLTVTLFDIALAVGVTALFGIVFGLGPAKNAADLSPIKALRAD